LPARGGTGTISTVSDRIEPLTPIKPSVTPDSEPSRRQQNAAKKEALKAEILAKRESHQKEKEDRRQELNTAKQANKDAKQAAKNAKKQSGMNAVTETLDEAAATAPEDETRKRKARTPKTPKTPKPPKAPKPTKEPALAKEPKDPYRPRFAVAPSMVRLVTIVSLVNAVVHAALAVTIALTVAGVLNLNVPTAATETLLVALAIVFAAIAALAVIVALGVSRGSRTAWRLGFVLAVLGILGAPLILVMLIALLAHDTRDWAI
jgi:hypothetical protein